MNHHEYGMSNWPKFALCGAFRPANERSAIAQQGTESHEKFASLLLSPTPDDNESVESWAANAVLSMNYGQKLHIEERVEINIGSEVLDGIFGTPDVYWYDSVGILNVADYKTFSMGTTDYMPQLMGYALAIQGKGTMPERPIRLHVLHGGARYVQSREVTYGECLKTAEAIFNTVMLPVPFANENCKYCVKCGSCASSTTALTSLASGGIEAMTVPQALLMCDVASSIIDTIKARLKQTVIDAGGRVEDDKFVYEIKTRSAKAECHDIARLWFAFEDKFDGDQEKFLRLCNISKTAFTNALKEAGMKPKQIKEGIAEHFIASGEGTKYLSRTNK